MAVRQVQWKLSLALCLCLVFMVVEVVGGVLAHSLAVLTDAAHLLSDVSGFGVSLWAAWYASRRSQSTHTFGCAPLHTCNLTQLCGYDSRHMPIVKHDADGLPCGAVRYQSPHTLGCLFRRRVESDGRL